MVSEFGVLHSNNDPSLSFVPLEKASIVVMPNLLLVAGSNRKHRGDFRLFHRKPCPFRRISTPILEGFLSIHRDMPDDDSDHHLAVGVVLNFFSKLLDF